jgi:hypothetical protein
MRANLKISDIANPSGIPAGNGSLTSEIDRIDKSVVIETRAK